MTQPATLETMTVREIGALMAQLRGQFNLTPQEVSERLHIRTRYINAMEEGRFELMPGKVYARGYVHTYAEFLGLDAPLVVARCFAEEDAKPSDKTTSTRAPMIAPRATVERHWRGYGVLGVIALLLVLVISQISGHSDAPSVEESTVAPVPEAMLQSVRNLMMPTAANYACLTEDALLECFYADNLTRMLAHINDSEGLFLLGDIDVASLAVLPQAEAAPTDAAVEEKEPEKAPEPKEAAPEPAKAKAPEHEAAKAPEHAKKPAAKPAVKEPAKPAAKPAVKPAEKPAAKKAADKPEDDINARDPNQ